MASQLSPNITALIVLNGDFMPKKDESGKTYNNSITDFVYTGTSLDYTGNKSTNEKKSRCGWESTYEQEWLNDLILKEQDIVDGGITRKSIIDEMRKRGLKASMVSHYETCSKTSILFVCPEGHIRCFRCHCDNRLCPVCERRRKRRIMKMYRDGILRMKNPKLLTVTIGHVPINHGEVLSYWRKQFYKLIRKLEKNLRSGFVVMELSPDFYLHFHAILDTPNYIPQDKLSEMWDDISGRYVVHISKCNPRKAMGYVIKYIVKVPTFNSSSAYVDYFELTNKRRLFSAIGDLYGIKMEKFKKDIICEECGYEMDFFKAWVCIRHDFLIEAYGEMWNVP